MNMFSSDKKPKKGGAQDALNKLKELRKKEPSDRLVQIIEEVTNQVPSKKNEIPAAAKDVEI